MKKFTRKATSNMSPSRNETHLARPTAERGGRSLDARTTKWRRRKLMMPSCNRWPAGSLPLLLLVIISAISSALDLSGVDSDSETELPDSTDTSDAALMFSSIQDNPSSFTQSMPWYNSPNCTSLSSQSASLSQHSNRLECFLWNLQVEIPQQSFKEDFITITVHDMICSNFVVKGLNSSYHPSKVVASSNATSPRLEVSMTQLEATCQGRYHSTGGLAGDVRAHVVEIPDSVSFNNDDDGDAPHKAFSAVFSLDATETFPKVPSTCHTLSCATYLTCQSIHFSGSMSAKIIQAFSKTISKYITDELQTYICPKIIQQTAAASITHFLHHPFHDFVKKYLPKKNEGIVAKHVPSTTFSNSTDDDSIRNVFDYKLVRWALNVLNQQLRDHLQVGWIPLPSIDDRTITATTPFFLLPSQTTKELPNDCRDMFRGFSGFVKAIFGTRPRIRLPRYFENIRVPITALPGSALYINISEIAIQGMDQMDYLQALQPPASGSGSGAGNGTSRGRIGQEDSLLQSNLTSSAGFFIVAPVTLNITLPDKEPLIESFQVALNVTNVEISLSTLLQVAHWDSISMLRVMDAIQQFTDSFRHGHERDWKSLYFLIATLRIVRVQNWITFLVVDSIKVSWNKHLVPDGSLEADLDATVNTILSLFTNEYANLWSLLLRGIVETLGTEKFNSFISDWISDHSSSASIDRFGCATKSPKVILSSPKWVNFTKFELLYKLNAFLGHSGRIKTVNHFLRCLGDTVEVWNTNTFFGDFTGHHSPDRRTESHVMFQDEMTIERVEISNWDTLSELQILKPSGDTKLESRVVIGTGTILPELFHQRNVKEQSVKVPEMTVIISFEGPRLFGNLNITAFAGAEARAEMQIDYDLDRMENITVAALLDTRGCGLLPVVDYRMLPHSTSFDLGKYVGVNLTGELNGKIIEASTMTFPMFHNVISELVHWSMELARNSMNKAVAEWAIVSADSCPVGQVPQSDDPKKSKEKATSSWLDSPSMICLLVVILVSQAGLMWLGEVSKRSQETFEVDVHERYIGKGVPESNTGRSSDFSSFQELVQPLLRTPMKSSPEKKGLNTPTSLDRLIVDDMYDDLVEDEHHLVILEDQLPEIPEFQNDPRAFYASSKLPKHVSYALPATMFGTIMLLFTSNVSVGASVDLSLRLGAEYVKIPSIFQFSLGETASKLYHAGIYPLLLLVVCFSGIWPYAKLLWMLYAWFVPCKDHFLRERRLVMLNSLGKFSLVDSYVLVLFVVAFRFHAEVCERFGVDSYVTPVYGFHSFLLATILSLVLGHAMLFFHRREIVADLEQTDDRKENVLSHSFQCQGSDLPKELTLFSRVLLVSSILCATALVSIGIVQESFTFEFEGLAGAAIGDTDNPATYSAVSIGASIPHSLEYSTSFGAYFLQLTYFTFTIGTPLACLVFVMILMVWPLTTNSQRGLLIISEALNAWSAIEVFLLSVLAAIFQISQFAAFLIGDKCDIVNEVARLVFDDQEMDTVCFSVKASVDSSCLYLVMGSILHSWVVSLALKVAHAAVEERTSTFNLGHEAVSWSTPFQPNHGWAVIHSMNAIPVVGSFLFTTKTDDRSHRNEEEEQNGSGNTLS